MTGLDRFRSIVLPCVVLPSVVLAPLVVLLLMSGCGGDPSSPPTGSGICKNDFTGLCEPCAGAPVCVDPATCLIIACKTGGGVAFGDTNSGDAGSDTLTDDALLTDVLAVDTGPADTGTPDTGTPDTGPADTGTPDTGPADAGGTCSEGTKTCLNAATPQFCFQGDWMKLATCTSGYTCVQGACACAKECVALGQQACIPGVAAFKTCQLDGSCLKWGVPLACQPGQVCEGGQCKAKSGCTPACASGKVCQQGVCVVASTGTCTPACAAPQVCEQGKCVTPTCNPACASGQVCKAGKCEPAATGTLGCGQIMACVNQFSQGPKDTVNINACIGKGTAPAQAEYIKRKSCIALSCQTLIDAGKVNEAMLCVYTYCAKEQTGCLGTGTKTCSGLGGCLTGCGTSAVCTVGCHADTSVEGIKGWYLMATCGEQKCAGTTGNAYATCVTQNCASAYQSCFGTTGGGGYSCAQVLQCAGSCGQSKSCAQACKGKASTQGLSTLNALLACSNTSCASYCSTGTQQQCDACMSIYCKSQQAACQ